MKLTLCLLFRNVVLMWQPLVYNPFANTFHTTEQERWRGGGEGEILNWEIKWEILNEIDGWKTETSSEKKWMLKVMRKKWHKNRNKNRFAPEESKISFGIVSNQTLHEMKQEIFGRCWMCTPHLKALWSSDVPSSLNTVQIRILSPNVFQLCYAIYVISLHNIHIVYFDFFYINKMAICNCKSSQSSS